MDENLISASNFINSLLFPRELKKGHLLQGGKYRIIEKIGQGGFAFTYKANWATEIIGPMGNIPTDVTVAIKEFFFADYCTRDNDISHITISSPTGAQIFDRFKAKMKKKRQSFRAFVTLI